MIDVQRSLDFGGVRKLLNLPNPTNAQDAATMSYVDSLVEGLAWKDSARVSTQGNVNLAAPGGTIDGVTMVANDRVLVRAQTAGAENGIYIWNGSAVPMTRSLDANTAPELEQAVVTVEEGTSAGASFRQSVVNFTLNTTTVTFGPFGTSAGAASTTTAGVVQLATQAETDTGTDALKAITPATLAGSAYASKKFNATIGDGSATSITVTHNLNTRDLDIVVYRNSGNFDDVLVEVQRTSLNAIAILFDTAPAANAYRVVIRN